jgi:hypothetical protein
MLSERIRNALKELLDNPCLKTKKLLPKIEDRLKLYSLPAFEIVVMARRQAKKSARRARRKIKKNADIRVLVRTQKRLQREIEKMPLEEKISVKADHIVMADIKQGNKSISYYDAEAQALAVDARYICLTHNLALIKNNIFEMCKQAVRDVMEKVPTNYRHYAAGFLRQKFGYAPGRKVLEVPGEGSEEKRHYIEVNIFADDRRVNSKIEKLMQPGTHSRAEEEGWSKLSQAGYIDPETGRLGCSFA